ncbi:MAG TPA: prepilin-type N-terminal cleavage/methylation domain-containing protein [Candidatus Acidoferrum sp.]|nr:prepilin-type N-terminal cleavage/methylation domain-containing protein [Candidatus Acidoferrum sp.]
MLAHSHNSSRNEGSKRGFSLVELLIVVAIILLICAIAIPNLLHAKIAANQAAAAANVRAITSDALTYQSTYQNGFPPSLAALGGTGTGSCNAAALLDDTIAATPNQKSGYTFAYSGENGVLAVPGQGCGAPGYNGYFISATPITESVTGDASYCSYTPASIYFDNSGTPAADPNSCAALPPLQ